VVITSSILYNLVECPHRVSLDAFGSLADRDVINPFVRLLWERGSLFERETIGKLEIPFLDLSKAKEDDRERLTLEAMARGEPLIYGGQIRFDDLMGRPGLLRRESGVYIPGDVKSGRGKEGGDEDLRCSGCRARRPRHCRTMVDPDGSLLRPGAAVADNRAMSQRRLWLATGQMPSV
jgi:hypothetical protein